MEFSYGLMKSRKELTTMVMILSTYLPSLGMAEPDLPLAPPIMLDQSITIPNRGADYAHHNTT